MNHGQGQVTPLVSRWEGIVRRHTRMLRRGSPVRECAETILAGGELDAAACSTLLEALTQKSGKFWRERMVAAWCLGQCELSPPEWRESVTDGLRRVLKGDEFMDSGGRLWRAVKRNVIASVAIPGIPISVGLVLLSVIFGLPSIQDLETILFIGLKGSGLCFIALMGPAAVVSGILEDTRLGLARAAAARSLGERSDPLAAGLVARAMTDKPFEVRAAAEAVLQKVLSAVRPSDYGRLPANATVELCSSLDHASTEQSLWILEALRAAGTGGAAEPVRRLAEQTRSEAVLAAAAQVLPVLEERLRLETSAARLLRPEESPGEPGDILLRPASAATAVPEEQLLRPSVGPDA